MNYTKSFEDLLKSLEDKIEYLKLLVKESLDESVRSSIRIQKINSISVILRDLTIDSGNQQSLISKLNIKHLFYFQYKNFVLAGKNNLVPNCLLVGFRIQNDSLYFYPILDSDSRLYFGIIEWLNEVVLDDKEEKDNLVTRYEIIRAISDKEGAHTDKDYDPKFYKIGIANRLNIQYEIDGQVKKSENNIYYESIIAIANELINAYSLYKTIEDINKTTYVEKNMFIAEKIYLSTKITGYRYSSWLQGDDSSGRATLNILNFESEEIVRKVYYGELERHVFRRDKESIQLFFINFDNYQSEGVVINKKEPFCLVAIKKKKKKYLMLSGSTVSEYSKLDSSYFLFPGKSKLIKKNIESTINHIFDIIGIDTINI
ncbi:MAG: hypothetical protein PHY42_05985 [Bacilli bacterium]|nr:hypothetical protein [Bacilli bacterium]